MHNDALMVRLRELGPLPGHGAQEIDDFPLDEFDELLQQFTRPLTLEHAVELINLGPPPDAGSYGVEWALIHLVETIPIEALCEAVTLSSNTEVKRLLEIRLANYFKSNRE